jgi:uncharacterized OB-fold protein
MTTESRVVIGPLVTELTRPFWDAARRGVVSLQRCSACGTTWHPPQPTCPSCRSAEIEWIAAAGRGVVHAFTVVHHVTHPAVAGRTPYVVAVVELAEGPRFICNVLGCRPEDVAVGMPVRISAGEAPAGETLPQAYPLHPDSEGT